MFKTIEYEKSDRGSQAEPKAETLIQIMAFEGVHAISIGHELHQALGSHIVEDYSGLALAFAFPLALALAHHQVCRRGVGWWAGHQGKDSGRGHLLNQIMHKGKTKNCFLFDRD